ncbi:MAG: PAS domain-containing protein [Campylobacter sp.]|nr:PAS domain-containing protein [Campylobacter sp.]
MQRPTPKDVEIKINPTKYIVSRTDPQGVILFANHYFCEICGYSHDELVGQPHNIIRHPDMPKIVFKLMWDTINQGKDFCGIVKNLAKDGRYYWVMTQFMPKIDEMSGKIISHTAYRKAPPRKAIEEVEPLYEKLLAAEEAGGMEESEAVLKDFLHQRGESYNDFIDEITGRHTPAIKLFFIAMRKLFAH